MLNDPRERRRAEARRFLAALYGESPTGHLVLWLPRRQRAAWPTDLDEAAAAAVRLAATDDVTFGVALRRAVPGRGYGTARDVLALPALWADLTVVGPSGQPHDLPPDRAATMAMLHDFPLVPSALVATSRGYQAYWFLDEPFANNDLVATRAVLRGLGGVLADIARRHGWRIDEHVFTPARVMRLPGTVDRRQRRPRPVRIEYLDADRRYPVGGLRMAAAVTHGAVAR
jgi:hypothetical protein